MSEKVEFKNLGEALTFLDKERQEVEAMQAQYARHLSEIINQMVKEISDYHKKLPV